jgi:hypothetical protein
MVRTGIIRDGKLMQTNGKRKAPEQPVEQAKRIAAECALPQGSASAAALLQASEMVCQPVDYQQQYPIAPAQPVDYQQQYPIAPAQPVYYQQYPIAPAEDQPVDYQQQYPIAPAEDAQPIYVCPSCDREYRSSTGLYLHKKEHHPELLDGVRRVRGVANFFCDGSFCNKSFVTYGGLYQHKRIHHPWLINQRPEQPGQAAGGGGESGRPRGRPREADRNLADLKFQCPECDKAYASYGGLYQHKRSHHR